MSPIDHLLDRPRLYHNIDGLAELGAGIFCVGFALIFWLLSQSPAKSVWHQISILLFAALMLLIHYGTKAIKTRITYPRTGLVEYRKDWRATAIATGLGMIVPVLLLAAFRRRWDMTTLVSLLGIPFAASYAYHIARAVRWKWIVVWAMAANSLAIAVLSTDASGAVLASLLVYGTMLLISGGISFRLYLRHTQ